MTRLFSVFKVQTVKEESCLVCTMGLKFCASIIIAYNAGTLELTPENIYF